MLLSVQDLEEYTIGAEDGAIGRVKDCYFDDEAWAIRYIVVKTGAWLVGRHVLISPISVGRTDPQGKVLPVCITQEQVKNSPHIDSQMPVSRQHEMGYLGYYGYPYYWGGCGLWGDGAHPRGMLTGVGTGFGGVNTAYPRSQVEHDTAPRRSSDGRPDANDDQHLRSCEAVRGYHIHATDGDVGHVEGFLIDEQTWAIRYLIVNTSNWWLGHRVLVAPEWIEEVSWMQSMVTTSLDRRQIKDAPAYAA